VLRPLDGLFDAKDYPNLLVGLGEPDDAAVWDLEDGRALVVTTDFFTPVVDTPYEYGAIAAANSLSDIYAMGGKPFMALNVAALPPDLPTSLTSEILRGGAEKAKEAGVVIAGGHTVQDKEPKYGLTHNLGGIPYLLGAKDMRVAVDELGIYLTENVPELKFASLSGKLGMKHHLHQEVAQLVTKPC